MTAIKTMSEEETKESILHDDARINLLEPQFCESVEAQRNKKIIFLLALCSEVVESILPFKVKLLRLRVSNLFPWTILIAFGWVRSDSSLRALVEFLYLLLIVSRCVYYRYHKTPSLTSYVSSQSTFYNYL